MLIIVIAEIDVSCYVVDRNVFRFAQASSEQRLSNKSENAYVKLNLFSSIFKWNFLSILWPFLSYLNVAAISFGSHNAFDLNRNVGPIDMLSIIADSDHLIQIFGHSS